MGVGECYYETREFGFASVLSYFLFLFKSLPQEFVKLKIWQCSLLLIVVSCLFEFCRETSPSLVSGVMLLPHFSQSQANP